LLFKVCNLEGGYKPLGQQTMQYYILEALHQGNGENVLVQLLDTAGKELFAKNFTNVPNGGATIVIKSTRIGIASGLYIVKTTTQKSSSTRKVVFN